MLFRTTGNKQTLQLDGCEVLGLLQFKGKSEATSKIGFLVADGEVIARSRNGIGAELFIRGNAPAIAEYECTVDAAAFAQIKIDRADTITLSLGAKPRLELKHAKEDETSIEFPIHRHLSTQIAIGETVQVPGRPVLDEQDEAPVSIDLDWGITGAIGKVIGYAGSNRVRHFTIRDWGAPFYVELGQLRDDGKARWFATFKPYVDEDEALQDQGRQVVAASLAVQEPDDEESNIDEDLALSGVDDGDDEGDG